LVGVAQRDRIAAQIPLSMIAAMIGIGVETVERAALSLAQLGAVD
jgi:hypothetical protein